jgi:hypothetical protein
MIALLFPALALAFASPPVKYCQQDRDCVLVRHTYCGELMAITSDQDAKFAKWERKQFEKDEAAKRVCPKGGKPDPRLFEAFCGPKGECEMRSKATEVPIIPPLKPAK